MHPVETYLNHLARNHTTGAAVPEGSYYGALEGLLNEIGGELKPKVRCVPQLKNAGAGSPDFGLYRANQFQRAKDEEPLPGVLPERGVIEVKGWGDDSFLTAKSPHVSKYWQRYGLVLVTNYRDFVLVGRDEAVKPVRLEPYRMAGSEAAFLDMLAHPRKAAAEQGDRLVEFLSRVMLHAAALTSPEDLARVLASYAREARYRVEAADLPALEGLKKGLEEALGMKFEGEKGEHFFRATLVQTLFYGVFSSWVLWARSHPGSGERFNWHEAGWTLHVPMIKSLFEQIATQSRLKPLGVDEVLDWAGTVLNRVDRRAFFEKFEAEHAVQYFYEPFLKAYDPELRKELGVWYTPPEIVQYQVERVDRVLREELDIADGLADDRVVILDPCCGTGAYLVETLKRIHKTLEEKGASALTAQKLKKAAMERVFGFEILPAPFVVAHLQLGLMLRLLGAPLDHDSDQRAGVYLTNALTGWEPPAKPKDELPLFPELMKERDAANKVKGE
ncbi:MAG: N-6 DNA methylase, partial [Acidobacteria bacterium]|nr:N-6 DNA methylase [Acidobacteriota bacterium]